MIFKVGDRVTFGNYHGKAAGDVYIRDAMVYPYLTIIEIDENRNYWTKEAAGPWNGMHWTHYEIPKILDEELFEI